MTVKDKTLQLHLFTRRRRYAQQQQQQQQQQGRRGGGSGALPVHRRCMESALDYA